MIYKKFKRPDSSLGYRKLGKGGHIISIKDVPANILKLLETQDEVDDTDVPVETPAMECVACGSPTKMTRLINQQTVAVCDEHYHNMSLGQLAQAARLKQEKLDEENQHEKDRILQG